MSHDLLQHIKLYYYYYNSSSLFSQSSFDEKKDFKKEPRWRHMMEMKKYEKLPIDVENYLSIQCWNKEIFRKKKENIFVPDEVASYHSISTFFALFFLFIFYMTHTVMIQ